MSTLKPSDEVVLVPIDRPTALENETAMAVPGQDLFTNYVQNVHIIPERIDLERLKAALARAGARYPPVAGRLVREGDSWRINLSNESIPIILANEKDSQITVDPTLSTFPFPNDWIVQDKVYTRPFLTTTHPKWMLRGEGNEPLVVVKLTRWENKSAIGISWSHTLGDAKAFWDFTVALSTLYEDPDAPSDKLGPAPSFYRHFFPSPTRSIPSDLSDSFIPRMPHLANDYTVPALLELYRKAEEGTEVVHLKVPEVAMRRMLEALPALEGGAEMRLNLHDALSTYLVEVLNRSLEKPVRRVISIVNYRAPLKMLGSTDVAPFAHPAGLHNGVLAMISDPIPEGHLQSPQHIAQVIRSSIVQTRDAKFMERWLTLASFFMAKSANAGPDGRYHIFLPDDGDTTINSNYRFDWNQAHFGFPGRARFHTAWTTTNFFRIFAANPPENSTQGNPGEADVTFRIHKDFTEKYVSIVKQGHPDIVVHVESD